MASSEKEGFPARIPFAAGAEKIVLVAKAVLLAAILAALYFSILKVLVFEILASSDFSFVFLAVPILIVFLYCRRAVYAYTAIKPETAGLSLAVFACLVFIIGRASAEIFSTRVSLILLAGGLIWMFAGRGWLRRLSLPLLLLACFIPPPAILYNSLSNPIRDLLVRIASASAQLLGLSFYADGGSVNVPGFSVGTGDMCGSLHVIPALFITALMILLLIAPRRAAPGLALFTALVAVVAALGAIVLRMIVIAFLAAHATDAAAGFYHATSGWAVFLIGLIAATVIAVLAARRSGKVHV